MSGLREALVDLANRWDLESVEPAEDFVDAMSALFALPEHRDQVRALIGDKRRCVNDDNRLLSPLEAAVVHQRDGECAHAPVYAPEEDYR